MSAILAAIAGLIALAWGLWRLRARRYRAAFRIPTRRIDYCVCRGGSERFPIALDSQGFKLPPASLRSGASAFLEIDVAVRIPGHFLDPSIEVAIDGLRYRQYFERGAAGRRYLNISPVFQRQCRNPPVTIALRGNHIRWRAQGVLVLFDPPVLENREILVVSPHPDDSEIAAFGLYCQHRSWIATITAGERSPTDLSAIVAPTDEQMRWRARLRVLDSLTIPQLGNVPAERCLNLVFPDTLLKAMHDNPDELFRLGGEDGGLRPALRAQNPVAALRAGGLDCSWRDLVEDAKRTLEAVRPGVVVCPHPLLDPHYDHVFTTIALATALTVSAYRPALFLLYLTHVNEAPLYPFGGANTIVSLPPWKQSDWIADSVYSHSLSEEERHAKYFAVEAAHDLRVYSEERPLTARQLGIRLRREISAFVSGMGLHPTDYLRRAPRLNELYYVVSAEGFVELTRRATRNALAGTRAR